jgi:hypothetical protein
MKVLKSVNNIDSVSNSKIVYNIMEQFLHFEN